MNKKIIRFISLTLAVLMIFSLCACGDTAEEEEETISYATEDRPLGKEEVLATFNRVMATAKSGKAAVKYTLDQEAADGKSENEYIEAAFKTLADKITDHNNEQTVAYGEALTDIFPVMGSDKAAELLLTDIQSAVITDNEGDKTYKIVIKLNPETNPDNENSIYGKLYNIEKDEDILKNFDIVKDFMTVDSYEATYGVGTVKVEVDKATDHIVKLNLSREVAVETEVTGHGTLESVKTAPLSFVYRSTANYELDWDDPATADTIEA